MALRVVKWKHHKRWINKKTKPLSLSCLSHLSQTTTDVEWNKPQKELNNSRPRILHKRAPDRKLDRTENNQDIDVRHQPIAKIKLHAPLIPVSPPKNFPLPPMLFGRIRCFGVNATSPRAREPGSTCGDLMQAYFFLFRRWHKLRFCFMHPLCMVSRN